MKRACVIGWPIEHSRSPIIHGYWLKRYGIDGSYIKEAVRPEHVETFLRSLEIRGFSGCNVTVPHKETAYRAAEVRDRSAEAVGATNTIWLQDGRLHAANTDTYGFMANLAQRAPDWRPPGATVSVLGAGGAARAIVYGFLESGVATVRLFNRSRDRAEALAAYFGSRVVVHNWDQRSTVSRDSSVIVNTTSLGMKGDGDPGLDFEGFLPGAIAADIVYVPLETSFLVAARRHGLIGVDGLGMLLHQAVPGFEKWFGVRPEVTDELYSLVRRDIESAS